MDQKEPIFEDKRTLLERVAESQNLVFFGVFIILIPLMMHTATLLYNVSVIKNQWYAYFFAIGFDLAIFIFAAHGRLASAGGIAFVVFLLNVSVLNLDTLNQKFDPLLVKFIVTVVLSGTGAWILHSYVIMFNEKKSERNKIQELMRLNYSKEKELARVGKELEILKLENANLGDSQRLLSDKEKEFAALMEKTKVTERKLAEYGEQLTEFEIDKRATEKAEALIHEVEIRPSNLLYKLEASGKVTCNKCRNHFDSLEKYELFKSYCTMGCAEVELNVNGVALLES